MVIEICANSFESAKVAQESGADRIELCVELSVGGLTPSYGLIEKVISELSIPTHVLIRPRSGNFTFSESELDVMQRDIEFCKKIGCAGIVSGALTPENKIDITATKRLIAASNGMEFTFHRAFDWCENPIEALHSLKDIGVTRLLSSGQQANANDGFNLLKELRDKSSGTIEIMPGGGITHEKAFQFKNAGFEMIHFSGTKKIQTLANKPSVSMHSAIFFEEGIVATSNKEIISKIIKSLS
jgi:copper homeostasis protein